jgi:hypothetical protein
MRKVLAVIAFACALTGHAFAQSTMATLTGRVLDPSGAAIAGADVSVVSVARNTRYPGRTNEEGLYVITDLLPAPTPGIVLTATARGTTLDAACSKVGVLATEFLRSLVLQFTEVAIVVGNNRSYRLPEPEADH